MNRLMQILGIVLVIGLLYAVAAGLGLTRYLKKSKVTAKTLMVEDFEKVPYFLDDKDLGWTTNGYVQVEGATENLTHGKRSAKAVFLTEGLLYPTPTPDMKWVPQMIMDQASVKKMKYPLGEWQDYGSLKMDIYNPLTSPVTYDLQIVDSHSFVFEKTDALKAKGFTNLEIPLDEMLKTRLDLNSIYSLRFGVIMSGATEPVTLYLDNIHLEGDRAATAQKLQAAPVKTK
jgi:hypothetical protein